MRFGAGPPSQNPRRWATPVELGGTCPTHGHTRWGGGILRNTMRRANILGATALGIVAATLSCRTHAQNDHKLPWKYELQEEFVNPGGISFLSNETLLTYDVEPTGKLSSRKSPEISSGLA